MACIRSSAVSPRAADSHSVSAISIAGWSIAKARSTSGRAVSLKKYWAVEGSFDMPSLAGGRLTLGTYARHQDYPQEDFFGIGPDSNRDDHTIFKIVNTMAGGRAGVKPARSLTVGGGVEYFRHELAPGRNRAVPSIEARFTDATAPGFVDTRNFLRPYLTFEYRLPAAEERPQRRLVPHRGQPVRRPHRRVHVQSRGCGSPPVREHPGRTPRAGGSAVCIDLRTCVGSARAVLSDAARSVDTTRCAASATTAFADRTRFSRRPNTALRSGRVSTRRCSTMPARSPCDAPTSTSRTSSTTTASASDSTPTTARSCASTRGSAAATASTST